MKESLNLADHYQRAGERKSFFIGTVGSSAVEALDLVYSVGVTVF